VFHHLMNRMRSLMDFFVLGANREEELEILVPDFDNMPSWTKVEIADHAAVYGITLDNRKRKNDMIKDFREKYQNTA
jgi:hypothetical protein